MVLKLFLKPAPAAKPPTTPEPGKKLLILKKPATPATEAPPMSHSAIVRSVTGQWDAQIERMLMDAAHPQQTAAYWWLKIKCAELMFASTVVSAEVWSRVDDLTGQTGGNGFPHERYVGWQRNGLTKGDHHSDYPYDLYLETKRLLGLT